MEKTDKTGRSLIDTRGLPAGLDARYFYEYSSQNRRRLATGLEGFLYQLMPYTLIQSLAFAVDPFSQFKTSSGRISPVARTRLKKNSNVLQARSAAWQRTYNQPGYFYAPNGYAPPVYSNISGSYGDIGAQVPLIQRSEDSTRRLRVVGSDHGEFLKWNCWVESSPRSVRRKSAYNVLHIAEVNYVYRYTDVEIGHIYGPAATISSFDAEQQRLIQWGDSESFIQKHSISMFKGILPSTRRYSLARNVVELRDVPRSILQLQKTILDLRNLSEVLKIPRATLERIHSFKTVASDIPKEYLSYFFGWRQIYNDVQDLLQFPTTFGKRINLLLARNGQATTYRVQKEFSETAALSSGLLYYVLPHEVNATTDSVMNRKVTLKMVVNSTFEFPAVDTPTLKKREFLRQLGAVPTPTDLYNLVPWTWLVDWFTGFGNYVNVVDNINQDRDLINWGFITCNIEGKMSTTLHSQTLSYSTTGQNPNGVTSQMKTNYTHKSTFHFHSQVRKDLSNALNVNATVDEGSLTPYQLSILGALLASRSKFRR